MAKKVAAKKVSKPRVKAKVKEEKKIFVLDTSVILYDHNAIKNFQ